MIQQRDLQPFFQFEFVICPVSSLACVAHHSTQDSSSMSTEFDFNEVRLSLRHRAL
jgi:hypothetical protein